MTKPKLPPDPDGFSSPVVGMRFDDWPLSLTWGYHHHARGQLLYATEGCMDLYCDDRVVLLPPTQAAWIPGNLSHAIDAKSPVSYRSLYFRETKRLPRQMCVFQVSPLLKALILRACEFVDGYSGRGPEYHVNQVIYNEIERAQQLPFAIHRPAHKTLVAVFDLLRHPRYLQYRAKSIANLVYVSPRTLHRLCQQSLGMSFEQWRLQFKLALAIRLLEEGHQVNTIADELGYSHASAFIDMFKQQVGVTPKQYFTQREN